MQLFISFQFAQIMDALCNWIMFAQAIYYIISGTKYMILWNVSYLPNTFFVHMWRYNLFFIQAFTLL